MDAFISSNKATVEGRVFAFNPYYIEVETSAAAVQVDLEWGTYKVTRFTGTDNKVRFPIQGILQSFFVGVDFGDVHAYETGKYSNDASKLLLQDKTITAKSDGYDPLEFTFDIIWGALQTGEVEPTEVEIYRFGTLPLTITQNIGEDFMDSPNTYSETGSYGKELWINSMTDDGYPTEILLKTGSDVERTYTIKPLYYCNGVYLRWIHKGEYKYFFFSEGTTLDELKDGSTFGQNRWDMTDYKNDIQLKNKEGNPMYECGVPSATYNQQLHLIGLQRSIKQWVYENSVWIECSIKMNPIVVNRFKSNQEVNLTVIKPSLFMESL